MIVKYTKIKVLHNALLQVVDMRVLVSYATWQCIQRIIPDGWMEVSGSAFLRQLPFKYILKFQNGDLSGRHGNVRVRRVCPPGQGEGQWKVIIWLGCVERIQNAFAAGGIPKIVAG